MAPPEVLIVGCGIAGSTLATTLLLNQLPAPEKPKITILERASALRAQGQNIDIRAGGLPIIRLLGIEKMIREATTGEVGVQWVDAQNRVFAAFAADKSGRTNTPTADIEILRGHLAKICYVRSKQVSDEVQRDGGAGIEYLFGDYLAEIDQDGDQVRVQLAKSGAKRNFDLVVGADGLQSRTRSMVWGSEGEKDRIKRLGAYGGFFSMPRGETDSLWRRWYRTAGRRWIMLRPDQQNDRTTCFLTVVSDHDERLAEVAREGHLGVDSQKKLLEEYFQDAGWESKRALKEMWAADDFYYDLIGQVKMDRWSKGRVVLVGDAGYCASPLSGMGTTLALNGAYDLAGCILGHPNDHSAAFTEYEAKMRPLVERAQKLVPGMPHILCPETQWGVWILQSIIATLYWTNIQSLLVRYFGPPSHETVIADYGFRKLPEMAGPVNNVLQT